MKQDINAVVLFQVQKNNSYQREVDRLKEEINGRDIKIKWAQTKLKSEMEAHQVSHYS